MKAKPAIDIIIIRLKLLDLNCITNLRKPLIKLFSEQSVINLENISVGKDYLVPELIFIDI